MRSAKSRSLPRGCDRLHWSLESSARRFHAGRPDRGRGGLDLYGYAGGDPINSSDPFGLFPWVPLNVAPASPSFVSQLRSAAIAVACMAGCRAFSEQGQAELDRASESPVGIALMMMRPSVGSTAKAAARASLDELGAVGVQRAAAHRAIGRATSSETIEVLGGEGSDIVVRLTRSGRNGHQVIESTVRADGATSVVQRAYDALGKLLHNDPKTP